METCQRTWQNSVNLPREQGYLSDQHLDLEQSLDHVILPKRDDLLWTQALPCTWWGKVVRYWSTFQGFSSHITEVCEEGQSPIFAPRIPKDETISAAAEGSVEISRSSASSDRVRQTASSDRYARCAWMGKGIHGRLDGLAVIENIPQTHPRRPPPSNWGGGKHNLLTHFPKDPNCVICWRTTITRVSCRKNPETRMAILLARQKFGDVVTADHRIFNDEGESRLQHRYAIVVQSLATQSLQSYSC